MAPLLLAPAVLSAGNFMNRRLKANKGHDIIKAAEFRSYIRRAHMLDTIPNEKQMAALLGKPLYDVWNQPCALIEEAYDMDRLWNQGGRHGLMNIRIAGAAKRCARYMQ